MVVRVAPGVDPMDGGKAASAFVLACCNPARAGASQSKRDLSIAYCVL